MQISRLILSDVDGTLLDAHGTPRGWDAFQSSLEPSDLFVLASSRTTTDLLALQTTLGVHGALIAENGSMVLLEMDWPGVLAGRIEEFDGRPMHMIALGSRRSTVLSMMREVAASCNLAMEYTADPDFELGPREGGGRIVVLDDGTHRHRSLVVQVAATRRQRDVLDATLHASALTMVSGGRWQVVQCGSHKGIAASVLRNMLHAQRCRPLVIAVGDHANDRPMLELADVRIAVRRPDGSVHPQLASLPGVMVPEAPGPAAWGEISRLLAPQEVRYA